MYKNPKLTEDDMFTAEDVEIAITTFNSGNSFATISTNSNRAKVRSEQLTKDFPCTDFECWRDHSWE